MGVTAITKLDNRSTRSVRLLDIENSGAPGHNVPVAPGQSIDVNMWVPWATSASDFATHRLELQFDSSTAFWVWQNATNEDGDHIRFSTDGAWHDHGRKVHGVSAVDGNRTLVVRDGGFELTDLPSDLVVSIRNLLGPGGYRMSGQAGDHQVPSVPRGPAVAFSMAGPPSDALGHQPGARFLYRDEGKRYRFELRNGTVVAIHPDGTQTPLTAAVTYLNKRLGEAMPAPAFDLIAASSGRVFAKEQGWDRFWFATMDEMFVGARDDGQEIAVPSTYFKLDPECNQPGAVAQDLTQPFEGAFGGHPATVRFPLFQLALGQGLIDMMMVAVRPRIWHRIDTRPPAGTFALEVLALKTVIADTELAPLANVPAVQAMLNVLAQAAIGPPDISPPPRGAGACPTYDAVEYCSGPATFSMPGIKFDKVLDIGVGHVHWHEQYESVTGGELQPIRTGPLTQSPPITYADLYRFANGPVSDGDGYVDGTCNFYALVHLADNAGYALLYIDEQTYFTQRWRLADPLDWKGLQLALARDLRDNPGLYVGWDPARYWCPFRAGQIDETSRLAVARQVVLVTARDPQATDPADPRAVAYSINYSYATMDLTWRWRKLPQQAEYFSDANRPAEPVDATLPNRVYPETLRLREDMTIHLKGTRQEPGGANVVGRWYQRYLPATNELVPPGADLTGARPVQPYAHPWNFLPEATFQAADHFSHFGVYEPVDVRTQYYAVIPASDTDAQTLQDGASDPAPWVDTGHNLCSRLLEFQWAAPVRVPDVDVAQTVWSLHIVGPPRSPASLFNVDTMLRIEQRGGQWIALHWDKRDDDLIAFYALPVTTTVSKGARSAQITLQSNTWVERPPSVQRAEFFVPQTPGLPAKVRLYDASGVSAVKVAALNPPADPVLQAPAVIMLHDSGFGASLVPDGGVVAHAWPVTAAQQSQLAQYCSAQGQLQFGTTVWFQDIPGHVSVPEEIAWLTYRGMKATANPSALPLGMPVQLTIHATDDGTGAGVGGTVTIWIPSTDGTMVATQFPTDIVSPPLTFSRVTLGDGAPALPGGPLAPLTVSPRGMVSAPGYADTALAFTWTSLALGSVSLSPSVVTGGMSSTGTVTLTGPAPSSGLTIALHSDNPAAVVPAGVIIPPGAASATFPVTSYAVSAITTVTISAGSGQTVTARLTLNPAPTLANLSLSPAVVLGGSPATGTLVLNGPAPSPGVSATLGSSNAAVTVPATVTVPTGAQAASFSIITQPVAATVVSSISVSVGGSSMTAAMTLSPGVPVPTVVGDDGLQARAVLSSAGFVVVTRPIVDCDNLGMVVSQAPAGGTLAARGSTVTITVGKAPLKGCP